MNTTPQLPPSPPGEICIPTNFSISSFGTWENPKSPLITLGYPLPLLEMQLILIFIFTCTFHMFLRPIGIPQFASQIVAGLVLGPQLIDLAHFSSKKLSSDPAMDGKAALESVGAFGCMMYVFLMAVKTNTRVAFRNGKLPVVIAVASIFGPLSFGVCLRLLRSLFANYLNSHYEEPKGVKMEHSAIVALQSMTLLPVVTNLLSELKIINSELGRLATSAAVFTDFIGIFLLVNISFVGTYKVASPTTAYRDLAAMSFFALAVIFVQRPTLEWIVEQTPEGKPVRKFYINAIVLTALGSAAYTSFFNTQYVFGPLLVGLAVPDGPPLGSALEEKFEKPVKNLFLPVFVAVFAMKCDVMRIVYDFDDICYNLFLVFVTLVAKLAASLIPCLYSKLPFSDSFALALIMNSKGFIELFLYNFARSRKSLTLSMQTVITIYILLNAGIMPTIISSLYDPKRKYVGYTKRSIMNLKHHSELRILTCLHKPDNVSTTIGFLQLLSPPPNPRTPNGLGITVLHLMKLTGRSFPIMISHKKRSDWLVQNPYIETSMLAFNHFERDNWGSASVATFTAFSPENLMHEDVCTLALDQLTSMIVVPSGRTWSIDGVFLSDDEMIRRLNSCLLDHAPCSLGILVDRGHLFHRGNLANKKILPSMKRVAVGVIFIGGKDDREALSLANRMIQNPVVELTVIRFISEEETESTNWEYILDYEVLKDWKENYGGDENGNVWYEERRFDGGAEVTEAIRSLSNEYNMLIVGRHNGKDSPEFSGLTEEWMDLPELGPIGDLLASKDISSMVSVLVVQEQV